MQHGDRGGEPAQELHVVLDHDHRVVLASSLEQLAGAPARPGSCPATGSSSSSSRGSCTSSMPISSHCCWPWLSTPPARRPGRSGRWCSSASATSRRTPRALAQQGRQPPPEAGGQVEVLDHGQRLEDRRGLEGAADAEPDDRGAPSADGSTRRRSVTAPRGRLGEAGDARRSAWSCPPRSGRSGTAARPRSTVRSRSSMAWNPSKSTTRSSISSSAAVAHAADLRSAARRRRPARRGLAAPPARRGAGDQVATGSAGGPRRRRCPPGRTPTTTTNSSALEVEPAAGALAEVVLAQLTSNCRRAPRRRACPGRRWRPR